MLGLAGPRYANKFRNGYGRDHYTGLRLKDVANLQWSSVDLQDLTLTVTTRKTRKDVTVPIHQGFGVWLMGQTRGIGKAPVFTQGSHWRGSCSHSSLSFIPCDTHSTRHWQTLVSMWNCDRN